MSTRLSVSMDIEFGQLAGNPSEPEFKSFIEAYDRCRSEEGEIIPSRRAFDIMSISHLLAHVVLVKQSEEGDFIFSIVGEKSKERFDCNPIGQNYIDFVSPARRVAVQQVLETCVSQPCGMYSRTIQSRPSGTKKVYSLLALPFRTRPEDASPSQLLLLDLPARQDKVPYLKEPASRFLFTDLIDREFIDLGAGLPVPIQEVKVARV